MVVDSKIEKAARALARAVLNVSLANSGVMAINPTIVKEREDAIWQDYIPQVTYVSKVFSDLTENTPDFSTLAEQAKKDYYSEHYSDF